MTESSIAAIIGLCAIFGIVLLAIAAEIRDRRAHRVELELSSAIEADRFEAWGSDVTWTEGKVQPATRLNADRERFLQHHAMMLAAGYPPWAVNGRTGRLELIDELHARYRAEELIRPPRGVSDVV